MLLLAWKVKERPTGQQVPQGEKANGMDFPTSTRSAALKTC